MLTCMALLTLSFSLAAEEKAETRNREICDREYDPNQAPLQHLICRLSGAKHPEIRDCLIQERRETGGAGEDNLLKSLQRHLKCLFGACGR